jgi:hypothetical protein
LPKNYVPNNNIKVLNDNNLKHIKNEIDKSKRNLLWSSSPNNNNKINTYENLFSKKTLDNYICVRDKLIPDNKLGNGGIILPDLKNINNSTKNFNHFENLNIKKSINSKKINLRSISTDKAKLQQNININSITNDTSAFTHSSKKYFSPSGIGNQNYTEDLSKFRMGLLSAGSSSNNNIIIPMITNRRPVSNFNFGGGQLWNNFENNNKLKIEKEINNNEEKNIKINNNIQKDEQENNYDGELNKKEINTNLNNSKKNYNIYNKTNSHIKNKIYKAQDMKKKFEPFPIKNDTNNLYLGLDKIVNKLHKIKIEKGMMNTGILNSLKQEFNNDYQNQIEQFINGHLPMMFRNQNNNKINKSNNISDKNKATRSHSFNYKNNFH